MIKRVIKIFLMVFCTLILVGCSSSESKIKPNQELGWLSFYVPMNFSYQPDLRGLAYTENDRKIYINGDYKDRSSAVIIDVIKQKVEESLDEYVEKLNENIEDNKYVKTKGKLTIYSREKYEGNVDETIIYNYTYIMWHNNYIYSITISGPESKDKELASLKSNIVESLKLGN